MAKAVFIILSPRVETRFSIPTIKMHMQTPFSSCCVYHRSLSIASTSREEGLVTATAALRSLIRRHMPLRRSVRDVKAFQNNFAFIISTETCFWLKRVSDRTFFGVSNPLIKTAFRLSSAKITVKVLWKPIFYTRKVMINAPQVAHQT